ncbi:general L-amino acid transport system substrate-binding protein [Amphibacillus marinus]|uniref:General L-amino acid transport system substrate-binding protein n=1 Tax=Amphibacillus marinus TaxID=872970 RepID=A0A1H8IE32_9BACI|nr:amino acid ABC transporter substrate-binding protein [Amphibacillus marinus]SEN66475.1 general L-amino acid transport system substrate-binding protein [Amphibacillus marinus]
MKKKMKLLTLLLWVTLIGSVFLVACAEDEDTTSEPNAASGEETQTPEPDEGDTLAAILDRGYVIVGGNNQLPGFGYVNSDGDYEGFDVDFARVVAAALFDDPDALEIRPLSAQERFTALQTGEVDVLIRNTTWTLDRDVALGTNFTPTTFYDGQGIMVRADSGITSLEELEGARIGVETGTTTESNLADQFRKYGITYEQVLFDDSDAVVEAYESGNIDAWTTDKSGLVSRQATMASPDDHSILTESLSKEPLGPTVRHGDDQWFDIVKWATLATIEAEELGITSENYEEFLDSEDPVVRRFVGLEGELGQMLGIDDTFAINVIKHVGNYQEIYDRNLGPDTIFNLGRGLNDLYTNGGILYSPPFR